MLKFFVLATNWFFLRVVWLDQAMGGSVPFQEALAARLELIEPGTKELEKTLTERPAELSPGIKQGTVQPSLYLNSQHCTIPILYKTSICYWFENRFWYCNGSSEIDIFSGVVYLSGYYRIEFTHFYQGRFREEQSGIAIQNSENNKLYCYCGWWSGRLLP